MTMNDPEVSSPHDPEPADPPFNLRSVARRVPAAFGMALVFGVIGMLAGFAIVFGIVFVVMLAMGYSPQGMPQPGIIGAVVSGYSGLGAAVWGFMRQMARSKPSAAVAPALQDQP